MEKRLGLRGNVLNWFKSYLFERTQSVVIDGVSSEDRVLDCGVPQGLVLGPILFNIYILPLADLIRKHGIPFHLYADDSQKYTVFDLKDYNITVLKLNALITDMRQWFYDNRLKCNDSKTEVLVMSSKHTPLSWQNMPPLSIGNCNIVPSSNIRNLGVTMDEHLTLFTHVNSIVRSAFLKIREISYYRRFLTLDSTKTLMHAYVTSRVDYCNSLLFGLPNNLIRKLQSVLNTAARVVTMTRKYDSITPVLYGLHWLPMKYRIQFKLLLLVFKALNGLAPSYLSDKLSYKPVCKLRFSCQYLLVVPRSNLKSYGDRCFSVAGPKLWNSLPKKLRICESLESFKRDLKTHLFKCAFPVLTVM